jgi:hypothetical protein
MTPKLLESRQEENAIVHEFCWLGPEVFIQIIVQEKKKVIPSFKAQALKAFPAPKLIVRQNTELQNELCEDLSPVQP